MKHHAVVVITVLAVLTAFVFPAVAKPRPEPTVQIGKLIWLSEPIDMKWAKADDFCSGLEQDGGGWRMPTVKELQALYASEVDRKKIKLPFEVHHTIWASDPAEGIRHAGIVVDFDSGSLNRQNDDDYNAVTCVKPAQ